MIKPLTIFIDHAYSDKHQDGLFAKNLKERLKVIRAPFYVKTFAEINDNPADWDTPTLENIKSADIILPIITPEYLSFVSSRIENQFSQILNSEDKFLFPILLKPTNWERFSWIVKTKVIPDDTVALSEHTSTEVDKILNDFIHTIETIILKSQDEEIQKLKGQVQKNILNENVVFISHDHDDADFAELLKLQLEKHGIIGWIDSERLKIGQDWRQDIDDGIANSLAVIAIMTPEARKSEYVTYEWAYAWGKGKKIFPIMLKQTQLHPRLESLQYLDFIKREARPYDKLIKSIKELIDK